MIETRRAIAVVLGLVGALLFLVPASPAHAADHSVFAYGDAPFHGSTGNAKLNQPVVGMARTPTGDGYWLVSKEGRVFAFGGAEHHGSLSSPPPSPVVGIAATPSGDGYWLATAAGGIYTFGAAPFLGGLGHLTLAQPIVGITAVPGGVGYWMVGLDGGIFAFGDARFFGSTGAMKLNQPISGMAAAPGGNGYWIVGRDGGIFSFGSAAFHGSTGGIRLARSIVGMAATPGGGGYWLVGADGGLFAFGDAGFFGSLGGTGLTEPAVGIAGTPSGGGYWIVTTGHLAASPTANPPQVRIHPGTYRVSAFGPVIPGTYRTERASEGCYWDRRSAFSGGEESVLASRLSDHRQVVTVKEGDALFQTSGCAVWVNDIVPITRSLTAEFGDGAWVVGIDVGAGRWTAPGGADCTWQRVSDFSGEAGALKATDSGTDNPVVTIDVGDAGFLTEGCGTWTRA